MARSKGRSGGNRRSGGAPASPKAAPRKAASAPIADEIEVVEEEGGMGIDDGLAIFAAILMLVSLLIVDYSRGKNYGEGFLFKDKYQSPEGFTAEPAE